MNIKDSFIHLGPGGNNKKALLKDFSITASGITLTRANLLIENNTEVDETQTLNIPIWDQDTAGNAATASALSVVKSTAATAHYLTFVDSNNDSAANENFYTTANISIVPSTGKITMDGMNNGLVWKVNYLSGGWARDFIAFSQHTNNNSNAALSTVFKIGSYGNTNGYEYTYIGGNNYDGNNLRFNKDGSITIGTNKVWHAGNDGSGSGLDADLLDGQHLSDLDARYVLKAGDTMTGALIVPSLSVTGAATFSQAINGSILGNAATASRLQNARTISLTGSVTGSGTFDGSGNLSIATTTNHNHNSSYMTACALFTGASAATSATASLTNGNVYLNATKTINGSATNVGSIKISGSTGISVTTDANGHITVTGTTSYLRVGATGATANVTSATSNPYLALVEGTTQSSQVQLLASTGISISANNGIITFTNTSTNSHTYTSTWTTKTDNVNYPIAFSPNATPATSGNGYNTGFTFNPGTKTFNNNGCRQQYDSTNKVLKFIFD